jgi:uncharacterized protein DUF5681
MNDMTAPDARNEPACAIPSVKLAPLAPLPPKASPAPLPSEAGVPPGGGPDNTAQEQRGRPFQPGQSGNPKGRPKGSRNRTTLAMEALIEGSSEVIANKAIETGLSGDTRMLQALLRTMVPPRRDRSIEFELPPINTPADAAAASSAVIAACAAGELTPSEAREVMGLLASHVQIIEVAALDQRLSDLEKTHERPATAGQD